MGQYSKVALIKITNLPEKIGLNSTSFQTFVVIGLAFVSMALAMPYPYAMPDEPGYAAPAYGGAIGRVKIQVSKD